MFNRLTYTVAAIAAVAFCAFAGVARAGEIGSYTLTTPGESAIWTAPAGADIAQISAAGAQGGAFTGLDGSQYDGGRGAEGSGWLAVTPGESLDLVVGEQGGAGVAEQSGAGGCNVPGGRGGQPGGGQGGAASSQFASSLCTAGAGGGGVSSVRYDVGFQPILIAAGGGGASSFGAGGDAGAVTGASGAGDDRGASGGSQDSPGQPGVNFSCLCSYGATAAVGTAGGTGGSVDFITGNGGGGGGQGWFGGGGGAVGGGAGGSSYVAGEVSDAAIAGGARTGNGYVSITYGTADVPVVTADTPPHATAGSPFSYTFQASGWPIPTWSVAQGLLPPGLTLSRYGTLDGTPGQAGTYFFTLRAANPRHSVDATIKLVVDSAAAAAIAPGPAQTTLVSTTFPDPIEARVVDAYGNGVPGVMLHFALPAGGSATFTASGTTSSDATTDGGGWADVGTVAAGSTPGPLALTVSAPGTALADATINLTVDAPAAFKRGSLPAAYSGHPYSYRVPASGYPAPTVSLVSGTLPPGLALAGDGTISGSATAVGSYAFVLQAANGIGQPAQKSYTLAVKEAMLSISSASIQEGNSGTSTLAFPVVLDHAVSSSVTVSWQTADGTATAGSDYRAASGTLTIPAGSRHASVHVRIYGDTKVEPDETFAVTLSSPVGAAIAAATATGTILNDD